nr:MAG TPA: hypothetical protein [Caudoviricetes sp.]
MYKSYFSGPSDYLRAQNRNFPLRRGFTVSAKFFCEFDTLSKAPSRMPFAQC